MTLHTYMSGSPTSLVTRLKSNFGILVSRRRNGVHMPGMWRALEPVRDVWHGFSECALVRLVSARSYPAKPDLRVSITPSSNFIESAVDIDS